MLRLPGHLLPVKPGSRSRLVGSSSNSFVQPRPLVCSRQSFSRPQQAIASPGRSNVAGHAAAPMLEGPAAAAQDVGELLLRRWMGVDEEGHLPVYEVCTVTPIPCLGGS